MLNIRIAIMSSTVLAAIPTRFGILASLSPSIPVENIDRKDGAAIVDLTPSNQLRNFFRIGPRIYGSGA